MTDQNKVYTREELIAEVTALKEAKKQELLAQAEERKQKEEMADLERQKAELEAGVLPLKLQGSRVT